MTASPTSTADFFEAKYRQSPDPWDFAASPYELARYDAILAALNHRHYRHAIEPGCSIGVLTERLATLTEALVAFDFSPSAAAQAAARCAHLPNVTVTCAPLDVRTDFATFDLVVLSEIGYYFTPADWHHLTARLVNSLAPGATLLAEHWLGHSSDHILSGDQVHDILLTHPGLTLQHSERHEAFRLDVWERARWERR
jgi:cyclopropane fatty-acyl-phospholipid synthase-like methyltransferase